MICLLLKGGIAASTAIYYILSLWSISIGYFVCLYHILYALGELIPSYINGILCLRTVLAQIYSSDTNTAMPTLLASHLHRIAFLHLFYFNVYFLKGKVSLL